MKNFSISGARLALALMAAGLIAGPAGAATSCEFKADAPDQHTVVKGDTLWGISGQFLEHPWCWPQVWGMNKEAIHNPHWIYPGQIVYLDRAHHRLSLSPPGSGDGDDADGAAGGVPLVRMSPQLRTEGLGRDAVRSIPSEVIGPFLSQQMVLGPLEAQNAPRVVEVPDGRYVVGTGDRVYVRGAIHDATTLQVYRKPIPLRDPDTGAVLAYEAHYVGTVKLHTAGKGPNEASIFTVAHAREELRIGDILMQAPPTPLINYVPHPPERRTRARVAEIYHDGQMAGQNDVVAINRGSVDGIDIGSVLQLYHVGRTITDPERMNKINLSGEQVRLPDEEYGTLFVFRVFNKVSYALIMEVREPVMVGDIAKSPE